MLANAITFLRVLLTFVVIALFQRHFYIDVMLLGTIALIFALDAVDGYIARKQNQTSTLGAMLDIAGDRIIENTFWIYFAVHKMIPLWMPITVMARGILTDCVKRLPIRDNTRQLSPWTRALTQSRVSRGIYGVAKAVTFLYLSGVVVLKPFHFLAARVPRLELAGVMLAVITVAMCLIRGMPILIDSWHYFTPDQKER